MTAESMRKRIRQRTAIPPRFDFMSAVKAIDEMSLRRSHSASHEWGRPYRRVLNRASVIVGCCLIAVTCGCGAETTLRPSYVPPARAVGSLVSAKQTEDMGIVLPGYQQAFDFPVSNPSDKPIKLAVMHSSCSCVDATIDQSDLAARGSTTVRAKLHANDTAAAGPLAFEVRIAASGSAAERFGMTFKIHGIVAGLRMDPAVARVPHTNVSWEPKPLRGVFYFDRTKGGVEVSDLEWSAKNVPEGIVFGEPILSPVQDQGDHAVCRMAIPLTAKGPRRPEPGNYEGMVTYRVHGEESRARFLLQVVDVLE